MDGQIILVLMIVIPIIFLPAAFVWYLNIDGIYVAIEEARKKRVAKEMGMKTAIEAK